MPLIQDILDQVGGKSLFSNFDFQSGFHQIEVEKEHQERTAFITFCGLFEYLRMPFGVCGGPNTFQRVMEAIRRQLSAAFLVYLDDVILASDNESEHLKDIERLLVVLEDNGLKLRIDKCAFGKSEVRYLGFLISAAGIRPDPKNVALVKNFEKPRTLTQVRSFIGAVSYFRRFVPHFAEIMAPFYALTKGQQTGNESIEKNWKQEHEISFELIKSKLTSAPTLAPPKMRQPFTLETDASKVAIAACLLQKDSDGLEHPIGYASRKLNKHEAKYASCEMEALAIVFGLKEFRAYLEGAEESIVRTDNSALCSLMRRRDLQGRLAKYQLSIMEYNIRIVHRSGKSNTFCDYASRYPGEKVNSIDTELSTNISLKEVIKEQKNSTFCRKIFEELISNKANKNEEIKKQIAPFTTWNGALYKKEPLRLIIPYTLREKIVKIFHDAPLEGGHLGTRKTLEKIKGRFYWEGMNSDIKRYIKACIPCQQRKTMGYKHEPLHPIPIPNYPFERIQADICGPLPITEGGKRYIFCAIDAFSKWLICVPTSDQTALTITNAFIDQVVSKYGIPRIVITDNGRQFTSRIFNDLQRIYGFEHRTTTTYRPQTNGLTERQNRTVAQMLSNYVDKNGKNWDLFLQLVIFAYNSSVQESTQYSAFEVLFGRAPIVPLDLSLELPNGHEVVIGGKFPEYIQEHAKKLSEIWQNVKVETEKAQERQKEFCDTDRKAEETKLTVGELVLIKNERPKHKFDKKWLGPFRILSIKRPNVTLMNLENNKILF